MVIATVDRNPSQPRLKRTAESVAGERSIRLYENILGDVFNHVPAPKEAPYYIKDPRAMTPDQNLKAIRIAGDGLADHFVVFGGQLLSPGINLSLITPARVSEVQAQPNISRTSV